MGLRDFTLYGVIERNARMFADRVAIVFDGRTITHGDYHRRVQRTAAALSAAGVSAGDRIGVVAQNRPEFLDLYGAAAMLGAIVVPANWRTGADEIGHVFADTAPKLVVAEPDYRAAVLAASRAAPAPFRCIGLGPPDQAFESFDALLESAADVAPADVATDAGLMILHTAAVAGRPRGALLTHRGLLAANLQMIHHWRLGPDDVNLAMLPLFHVTGLGLFLAVLQAGGSTVLAARFDAAAAARDIDAHRVTLLGEFAPMLGSILEQAAQSGAGLGSLRIVTGLDTPDTIARFEQTCPDARFWVGYGQSEASGLVTLAPFRERPGSAGRPGLLCQVALVDEADRPLPAGSTGEIVVRGPMVFDGYWNLPADNEQTFRGGWHHTGDLGRFDDDGYLWYAGRSPAKELIKPGGENVYPAEVERALLEHPAIAEAVVFGVADPQWGEAVKAACVCRPGVAAPDAQQLIEFVGSRIARFKKPKHVVFVDALPRTASGAYDRPRIRAEHGDG